MTATSLKIPPLWVTLEYTHVSKICHPPKFSQPRSLLPLRLYTRELFSRRNVPHICTREDWQPRTKPRELGDECESMRLPSCTESLPSLSLSLSRASLAVKLPSTICELGVIDSRAGRLYIYIGALYCTRAQISFFRAAPLKLEKKRRKKKKKRSCLSLWHSTALLYRFVCVLSFSRARLLNLRVYWFPEPGLYIEQLAPIFSAYRELLSSEACVYIIYACLDLSRIYKCLYAQAWEFYCVLCDAWKWKESERVFERGQENCWEWPAERYI